MHELVAETAAGPSAAKHRFVSIETLLAHLAVARLDAEQQRLPIPAGFSDAHGEGV